MDTLCWSCRNAVPNLKTGAGCPWSRKLKPVEGWEAKETVHYDSGAEVKTFCVINCPLFDNDTGKPIVVRKETYKAPKCETLKRKLRITNLTTGDVFESAPEAAKWIVENGANGTQYYISKWIVAKSAKVKGEPFRAYKCLWQVETLGYQKSSWSSGIRCITTGDEFPSMADAVRWLKDMRGLKEGESCIRGRLSTTLTGTEPTMCMGLLWQRLRDRKKIERSKNNEKD